MLDAAKGERLWPYVAVSMLGGIRTEEARALRRGCVRQRPVNGEARETSASAAEARHPTAARPEAAIPSRGQADLHEPWRPDVRERRPDGVQADHREGRPRPGIGRRASCAILPVRLPESLSIRKLGL